QSLPGMMLDPADPINRGLVGWWPLNVGGGARANDKYLKGHTGVIVNAPVWSGSQFGYGLKFDATSGQCAQVTSTAALRVYPMTVCAWIRTTSNDVVVRGITSNYLSGSYNGYGFFVLSGKLRGWYFKNNTEYVWDGGAGMNGGLVNNGKWHHVAMTIDANGGILYVDGVNKATRAWTGTAGACTTTNPVCIGLLSTSAGACTGTNVFNGTIANSRIYERALSATEIVQLYTQPSIGLYTPNIGKYFITGAKTIAANTGAFILTGIDNALKVARLITSSTGDFTIVGNTTNLLTGRKITSETGAYVLTGNAAGLIYTPAGGYNFAVETGAFTLTGNTTNVLAQRKLGVTTGAFTLTGQEASLLFGRKIAVDTGVFALTGTSATLTAARKILAETGAYTFTGNAATLTSGATATYSKNTPLLIDSIGGKVLWIGLPKMSVWNTNGRPSAPTTGVVGFNSQTSAIEVWDGSSWKSVTLF
ncbi:MAG: LamG domain-containing protein, partial [Caldilineaceae bacterium]